MCIRDSPHPAPAPRTNPAVRAIAEANAQNDPRHIVQTAEIAGSQRFDCPHRISRRAAESGIPVSYPHLDVYKRQDLQIIMQGLSDLELAILEGGM